MMSERIGRLWGCGKRGFALGGIWRIWGGRLWGGVRRGYRRCLGACSWGRWRLGGESDCGGDSLLGFGLGPGLEVDCDGRREVAIRIFLAGRRGGGGRKLGEDGRVLELWSGLV